MPIEELIQLMRQCSLAKVRAELERWKEKHPENYDIIVYFYERAFKQKPKT
jgi:hypothetical protein